MASVLVTGGAGYIGGHAVLALIEQGYEPIVLDDLSTGSPANLPLGMKLYRADVGDPGIVRSIIADHRIRAVLHFAGSLIVSESVANPLLYYSNNTAKSLRLAGACLKAGVERFVFSSSAAVYGVPERQGPVDEALVPSPISPYGASKAMTERMLADLSLAHPDFRVACLRYFNVAGADPQGRIGPAGRNPTHLIRSAVNVRLGVKPVLEIFGADYPTRDGTCERDYIHVSDLAAVHVDALRYLEGGGESVVLNCGYGRGYTVREVVAALEALTGASLPVRSAPRRAGDPPSLVADVSQMTARLSWTPRHADLSSILETALRWEASALEVGG